MDNQPFWNALITGSILEDESVKNRQKVGDYLEGDTLLTSYWHQEWPYNAQCPDMGCPDVTDDGDPVDLHGHAFVGCIATAAAQIMHYYCWPPYGEGGSYDNPYDWKHMPDYINDSSPDTEINAVAELCAEVGQAAGMDYGCNGSSAYLMEYPYIPPFSDGLDMHDAYQEKFRFKDVQKNSRDSQGSAAWFSTIKDNINANHPIQYSIDTPGSGHSMVCDGWHETAGVKYYHMNYGWGD